MKVSAFTFIRNGQILGYPFIQSIKSILPIVDEFVINVGTSEDDTLEAIQSIDDSKIRIIQSHWNDNMQDRGYTFDCEDDEDQDGDEKLDTDEFDSNLNEILDNGD